MFFHRPIPTGFRDQSDASAMRVIFRAILPIHCWGISGDSKPLVYLRFGNEELGSWQYDFGPGEVEKYIESMYQYNVLYEVRGVLYCIFDNA